MAIFYKINKDGTEKFEEVFPENGEFFTYQELQEFVREGDEDTIQIVPLPDDRSIIVNENGKNIGLAKNKQATEFWQLVYPIKDYPNNNDELIVGNALVASESELTVKEF